MFNFGILFLKSYKISYVSHAHLYWNCTQNFNIFLIQRLHGNVYHFVKY